MDAAAQKRGLNVLESTGSDDFADTVRLLEDCEYTYRLELDRGELQAVEPQEVLSHQANKPHTGRLRPGRAVGTMEIVALLDDDEEATAIVEVTSSKLGYDDEYQSMLMRIAEEGAEIVQSSFAPSAVHLEPDGSQAPETIYQRFAFLQSLLKSPSFLEAMDQVRYRPHSEFQTVRHEVDPARSMRPSSQLARQLAASGDRQPIGRPIGRMTSLPRRVWTTQHVESLDTEPNRFIRFALLGWKELVSSVRAAMEQKLEDSKPSKAARRGAAEAARLERQLERLLQIPAIAEAGELTRLPTSNTVLHSRAGYRDVYRSYLLSDVASSITWAGGDDVYRAGQRDAATLYEYWVFIELFRIVRSMSGFDFDMKSLVTKDGDGWSLSLRRDGKTVLHGRGIVRGRPIELELWFNRSFGASKGKESSWTVSMRPDCSLRISPEGALPEVGSTWIHFDAKYRIDNVEQIFSETSDGRPATAKSEDLRKMHAYRDAIRRTSGAYVVFPGVQSRDTYKSFEPEVLPGLGAFALRPSDQDGKADSASSKALQRFIAEVIEHVSLPSTSRERERYWQGVSRRLPAAGDATFSTLLTKPPADTSLLLGFLKSSKHLDWVRTQSLYNLRADDDRRGAVSIGSPELGADFVVLYREHGADVWCFRTTGALYLRTRAELEGGGYPAPGGSTYLCVELGEEIEISMTGSSARDAGNADGSPRVWTWQQLFGEDSD